jgi:uracil-DNA glycosylase family 4
MTVLSLSELCTSTCALCDLHQGVKSVCVPGRGAEGGAASPIKLLVVGEAPGREEDTRNLPFVGPAGQLLEKLMAEAGIDQAFVRYENITRCWPRDAGGKSTAPNKKAVSACLPYLYRVLAQVALDQETLPLIVALGNTALEALTGHEAITRNRGIIYPLAPRPRHIETYGHLARYKVIGTIHPSALLRSGQFGKGDADKVLQDLRVAWAEVNGQKITYGEHYRWLDTLGAFDQYADEVLRRFRLDDIEEISLDFETTSLDPYGPDERIVCASLCATPRHSVVVPLYHQDSPWMTDDIATRHVFETLNRIVAEIPIVGWGLKFDLKWAWLKGKFDVLRIAFDGLLARHWRYGTEKKNDLDTVAATELGFLGHGREIEAECRAARSARKLPRERSCMEYTKKETLTTYAGGDTDAALQLCGKLKDDLVDLGLYPHYLKMMVGGIRPVAEMEVNGVAVSKQMTAYLSKEYPAQIEPLRLKVEGSQWARRAAQTLSEREKPLEFSIGSGPSLRELLFVQMGLPYSKVSEKTQDPSVDKEVLTSLLEFCEAEAPQYDRQAEIIEAILEHRRLTKLFGTYVASMEEHTRSDGYFHTTYNIHGTTTGRHSSSDPSIHTLPKGSDIRMQFISRWARRGGVIISADAGQAEMRVASSLANDLAMIETICGGVDLHVANAAKIFRIPQDFVSPQQRDIAKTLGFGILYGMSASRLSRATGIPLAESQALIEDFFTAFSGLRVWMDEVWSKARKNGLVTTPFGRLRWLPDARLGPNDWNAHERLERAKRQAINFPVQSSSSDVVYLALIHIIDEFHRLGMESKVFGFIHDAIVVDCAPGEWWSVVTIMKEAMTTWTNEEHKKWLKVPMVVDFDICPGWGFPCKLSWDEETMSALGSELSIQRLLGEILASGGHVFSEAEAEHKKKAGKRVVFSPGVPTESADARLGRGVSLF